jgi:hypothetical protein
MAKLRIAIVTDQDGHSFAAGWSDKDGQASDADMVYEAQEMHDRHYAGSVITSISYVETRVGMYVTHEAAPVSAVKGGE